MCYVNSIESYKRSFNLQELENRLLRSTMEVKLNYSVHLKTCQNNMHLIVMIVCSILDFSKLHIHNFMYVCMSLLCIIDFSGNVFVS